MKKNKSGNDVPTHFFQFRVMDGQSISLQLRARGRTPTLDRKPPGHVPRRVYSDWDNIDKPFTSRTSLGCGRKPESPEKTHTDAKRMYQLHPDSGPRGDFFFLYQC